MSATIGKKPRVSLEKYLFRGYGKLLKKYEKLALALYECGDFETYQFRKGLERVTYEAVESLKVEACAYWGRNDVDNAVPGISGSALYQGLRAVVDLARRQKRIKRLRETCGPNNPAPDDAPIEILTLSEEMNVLFKKKNITEVRSITSTRERLELFYEFKPKQLDEIDEVLKLVGRTFATPRE